MKFFAIVVVLSTLAYVAKAGLTREETMEVLHTVAAGCVEETGATDADIDVMIRHAPAENQATKCLRACVMKKMNMMNADGKFDKDNALKLVETHAKGDAKKLQIADEVINACKDIPVPADHCEAAELYKMCIASEAEKHGVQMCV